MQHRTDLLELLATFFLLLAAVLTAPSVFGQQHALSFAKVIADVAERASQNSGSYNALVMISCLYGASFLNSCPKRGGFVLPSLRVWRGWSWLFGPEGRLLQGEVRSEAGALHPNKLYIFCMFPHGSCE
jgi:hypothetical protein